MSKLGHSISKQTPYVSIILGTINPTTQSRAASGVLYKEYCKLVSKPVVPRAYRNYMKKMVNLGLVKTKGKGRWKTYQIVL